MERSKIRLNILEELAPAEPIKIPQREPRASVPAASQDERNLVETQGENVYKNTLKEYPYTCFVETSGLLVVISHSGYCCKFSIELQNELPALDLRSSVGGNPYSSGQRISPSAMLRNSTFNVNLS